MNVDSEARLLLQLCVCNIAHLLVHGEKVSVCQHLAKGRLRKLGDTTYLVSNETLAISQLILAVGLDGDVGGEGKNRYLPIDYALSRIIS